MSSPHSRKAAKSVYGAAVVASLLALSACDNLLGSLKADAPTQELTPAEIVEPLLEVPAAISWNWTEGSLEGWTFGQLQPEVVHSVGVAGISIQAPAEPAEPDVYIVSPLIKFDGSKYDRVLVDLEAGKAATKNDLRIFYSTSSHGLTGEFVISAKNGSPLADGERRVLVYEVAGGTVTGDDWKASEVQRLRFDLPQGALSEFTVHGVLVCNSASPDCK